MKFFAEAFKELGQPEKIHVFKNAKYIDPYRTKPDKNNGLSEQSDTSGTSLQSPSQSEALGFMKTDPDAAPRTRITSEPSMPVSVPAFELNSVPPATRISTTSPVESEKTVNINNSHNEAQEITEDLTNGDASDSDSCPSPEPQIEPPCAKDLEIARLSKLVYIIGEQNKVCETALRQAQAETQQKRKAETQLRYELIKCQNDRTKAKKEMQKQVKELKEKTENMEKELNTMKRRSSLDEEDVKAELAYANAKIMKYEAERSQLRNLLGESTMLNDVFAIKKEEECKEEPLALPSPVKETVQYFQKRFL